MISPRSSISRRSTSPRQTLERIASRRSIGDLPNSSQRSLDSEISTPIESPSALTSLPRTRSIQVVQDAISNFVESIAIAPLILDLREDSTSSGISQESPVLQRKRSSAVSSENGATSSIQAPISRENSDDASQASHPILQIAFQKFYNEIQNSSAPQLPEVAAAAPTQSLGGTIGRGRSSAAKTGPNIKKPSERDASIQQNNMKIQSLYNLNEIYVFMIMALYKISKGGWKFPTALKLICGWIWLIAFGIYFAIKSTKLSGWFLFERSNKTRKGSKSPSPASFWESTISSIRVIFRDYFLFLVLLFLEQKIPREFIKEWVLYFSAIYLAFILFYEIIMLSYLLITHSQSHNKSHFETKKWLLRHLCIQLCIVGLFLRDYMANDYLLKYLQVAFFFAGLFNWQQLSIQTNYRPVALFSIIAIIIMLFNWRQLNILLH